MVWQSFETLPTEDVGPLLGFDVACHLYYIGQFFDPANHEYSRKGEKAGWEWTDMDGQFCRGDDDLPPSHWQLLPPPPSD